MAAKIEMDVDRQVLVRKMRKCLISQINLPNLCLLSKPKVVYLRPFYVLHHFPNFENKIQCILDVNVEKLNQVIHMNFLLFLSIPCP